ncbi:MAG: Imm44 family immunity protein [Polyangiaceae bacterium]
MGAPFWISGEVEGDVYDDYSEASNEIETVVKTALSGIDLGASFKQLSLIPILLAGDDPDYGEVRKYHKKDRDFEFRLKISHAAFKAADALGQRQLIVENILRAVEEMKKMRIKDVDCAKLEQAIREVAASKGWLPPSLLH